MWDKYQKAATGYWPFYEQISSEEVKSLSEQVTLELRPQCATMSGGCEVIQILGPFEKR